MTQSNSKEPAEIVEQAHRVLVRGRQAERLPYNQKGQMALGLGWWSVQQSFVECRSAASDQTSAQGYGSAGGGSYNNKKDR